MNITPRTYRGRSAEQRRAERRQKFVEAALKIWGDQGWAAVTMRGVCARAGLIDRYFYESFTDRDALLLAVWDQLQDETVRMIAETMGEHANRNPAGSMRAVISTVVHGIVSDPRRARIEFGEHVGSAALERRRRDTLQRVTDLFIATGRPYFKPGVDLAAVRMSAMMGIGGFYELVMSWHAGIVDATAEQIIDHATKVGELLANQYLLAVS